MIVTLTPNPSVDRTILVDGLPVGSVIRSRRSWTEPSGKGVNVALALHAHGRPVRAVLPVGGSTGAQLLQMLRSAGLATVHVPLRTGEIRSNISLAQPDGTVTKVNEAGPTLAPAETAALAAAALADLDGVSWLVCGGSLPAGVPTGFYADIVEEGHRRGVRVAVDSSGSPLAESLAAGPDLIKPNSHELAELTGRDLPTLGDVLDAADELVRGGVGAVLASLGADGLLYVDGAGALHAEAPVARVVSTVGAGDATLAGFLAGPGPVRDRVGRAVSWGATAVQHEGTLFPADAPRPPVVVHPAVDRDRLLDDARDAVPAAGRG